MYTKKFSDSISRDLTKIDSDGKFKREKIISSAQSSRVVADGQEMLMFASNNYLGLANDKDIIACAKSAMDQYGFGTASVRFLSGTQDVHRELEKRIAKFIGTEDAILYSTNFMANLGFFATIVNEPLSENQDYKDVIYSDANNHASLIDAFKLCKKEKLEKRIYRGGDLEMLEQMLEDDQGLGFRNRIIVTDGIFSMEGAQANLKKLVEIANKYEALLFVDDAHGVGVMGENGRGTTEAQNMLGMIDVISGTFGKALGGALGGYVGADKNVVEFLRQKSRTYLFSNALPASVVVAGIKALDMLEADNTLVKKLSQNAEYFRQKLEENNLPTLPGSHAIVPLMIGDAKKTVEISQKLYDKGIYATGMSFPVVPEGEARIRFQISALHTKDDIDLAINSIKEVWQ